MAVLYVILACVAGIVVLYLLMIMPQVGKRTDSYLFTNHLYAHRGLFDNDTDAPENSMKAFKKAVDAGYGIEMDIQLTKDNEVVVFHDAQLERMCHEEGKVRDYTLDELQKFSLANSEERIPLFWDVLSMVDGKVPLIIEYKMYSSDTAVCVLANEILEKYQGVYCIESFNPFVVLWYKKHRKDIIRGQLSEDFLKNNIKVNPAVWMVGKLLFNFIVKPDFVAYNAKNYKSLSRRLCRNLYKNTAVAWTIKDQTQLDEMKEQFDLFIFDSFVPDKDYMKK